MILTPAREAMGAERWAAVGLVSPASFFIQGLGARLLRVSGSFPALGVGTSQDLGH